MSLILTVLATLGHAIAWLVSCAMLGLTTFTDRARISDLVKWEVNPLYTRDSATIKNLNAAAVSAGGILVGTPLSLSASQYGILQSGNEANVKALFLGNDSDRINEALAANAITAGKYQILVRGPAIINKSMIPTTDGDGQAIDVAAICTALLVLGITTEVEPTSAATGTQTT